MTSGQNAEPPLNWHKPSQLDRRLPIFFIYFVVGPPVGGLLFTAFFTISMLHGFVFGEVAEAGDAFFRFLGGLFVMVPLAVIFSYFFGGVQAAVTGLFISGFAPRNGRFGYLTAFVAAIGPSLAGAFLIARESIFFGTWLAAIGTLASLMVRYIFRRRFSPSGGTQNET